MKIIIFCLFMTYSAFSKTNHPIRDAILYLNKSIPKETAMVYSNIIARYSKRYQLDPLLVVAIARQESNIILDRTNGYFEKELSYDPINETHFKVFTITDYCMMQIHRSNVKRLNLDGLRLLKDPHYCISEALKILRGFKDKYGKEQDWWTRYNASNPIHRQTYKSYISRYLYKIRNFLKYKENKFLARYHFID